MLPDSTLLNLVKQFINEHVNANIIKGVYDVMPDTNAKTPYAVLFIDGAGADRIEADGGNEEEVDVMISILARRGDYGTEEDKRALTQLNNAVNEMRRIVESKDYLKQIKRALFVINEAAGTNLRVSDFNRNYDTLNVGESEMRICNITTPFIVFNQKDPL